MHVDYGHLLSYGFHPSADRDNHSSVFLYGQNASSNKALNDVKPLLRLPGVSRALNETQEMTGNPVLI